MYIIIIIISISITTTKTLYIYPLLSLFTQRLHHTDFASEY